jgi:hypothetical protein
MPLRQVDASYMSMDLISAAGNEDAQDASKPSNIIVLRLLDFQHDHNKRCERHTRPELHRYTNQSFSPVKSLPGVAEVLSSVSRSSHDTTSPQPQQWCMKRKSSGWNVPKDPSELIDSFVVVRKFRWHWTALFACNLSA